MNFLRSRRSQGRPGFTIIELAIVIGLISFLVAIISTTLFRPRPDYQREKFVDELSSLVADTFFGALELGVLHRVVFDMEANEVRAEKSTGQRDSQGNLRFEPVEGGGALSWPSNLDIKNFYVNRHDEIMRTVGAKLKKVWFYITPGGVGQEVTINMLDMNDIDNQGKPVQLSIVLNPFTLQWATYGTFQKP